MFIATALSNYNSHNETQLLSNCFITKAQERKDVFDFTKSMTIHDAILWENAVWKSMRTSIIMIFFSYCWIL